MKKIFTLMVFLLPFVCFSQSMGAYHRIAEKSASTQQVSAGNPWLAGASFGSAFGEGNDIKDNFLFTARLIRDIEVSDRFHIPIMANAALPGVNDASEVLNDRAISGGLYPYYVLRDEGSLRLLVHGAGVYRLLTDADSSTTQVRLLGGLEGHLYGKDGGLPTTVSVAPSYTFADNAFVSLEVDAIIPLTSGLGVLLNYVKPFSDLYKPIFQAGIILTTKQ